MIARSAVSSAAPEAVWDLLARPARWAEWAPHVRGAWGLAGPDGTVAAGASGAARLVGVVPVPVTIVAVSSVPPTRSWTWRVGGVVEMDHVVVPDPEGARVTVTLRAPAPLERALDVSYGPLVGVLVRRLARVAETD